MPSVAGLAGLATRYAFFSPQILAPVCVAGIVMVGMGRCYTVCDRDLSSLTRSQPSSFASNVLIKSSDSSEKLEETAVSSMDRDMSIGP